jgi:hypothetical protein
MGYGEFAEALLYQAVSPERVVEAVRRIAGDVVELGPIKAGPGGRATVVAKGHIGEPEADETGADPLTYAVRLPVDVALQVKVGTVSRYEATGAVDLTLTAGLARPLNLVIDVAPVGPNEIHFDIAARGVQAKLLGRAGDVEGELRRHTADYVNERISSPAAARFTNIELLPLIESVWSAL